MPRRMGSLISFLHRVIQTLSRHRRRQLNEGQPESMLTSLPIEILDTIATYLHSHDVLILRQTCSALYDKTNEYCSRRLFSTLTTDLSRNELTRLADIVTANRQLASAVRFLRIAMKDESRGLGHGYRWRRQKRGGPLVLPSEGFDMLNSLTRTHLPHCHTVQIHARDRQSEIDGPDEQLEPADVVRLFLCIAVEGTSFRMQTLEVGASLTRRADGYPAKGTHLSAERLPPPTLQDRSVLALLSTLESVSLNLVYPDSLVSSGWLPTLFASFACLKILALDLDMASVDSETSTALLTRIRCPALEQLYLTRVRTTIPTLHHILDPCSLTLRTLHLALITVVISPSPGAAEEDGWIPWLRTLPTLLPKLADLELDLLSSLYSDHRSRTHLLFSELPGFSYSTVSSPLGGFLPPPPLWRAEYTYVPPSGSLSGDISTGEPLEFEVMSHGWGGEGNVVLPGIRYRGVEMGRAVEFLGSWAGEVSLF
jgi:hypothetical protein